MKRIDKMLAVVISAALITTSIPPREVEASWFSDFCGFIFTVGTIPIWVLCPNNPTFRKNNPFRKKSWEVGKEVPKNNCKLLPRPPKKSDNTIPDKSEEPVLSETVSTKHKNYALVDPNPADTVEEATYGDLDAVAFKFKLYNGVIVEKEPRIIKIKTDSYYPTVNPAYAEYDISGYNKDGYNRHGYDKAGFNKAGVDRDGYGKDGYNKDGYNKQGFRKNADLPAQTTQRSPATTPSPTISATPETTSMEIDDGNKKDNGSNILEWIKEQVKKLNMYQKFAFIDIGLAQVKKIFNKWKNPHRKTDKEYKREVMDRMDSNHRQDPTGADYRGYRDRWQVVTRVAHYLRKVSAFIEDNMFLTGMGVDGCGNMHMFLEPNRGGVFNDANFNVDAIIYRIITGQRLDLSGLNLLVNLRALHAAVDREAFATRGHPLIQERLIDRRNDIAEGIAEIEREKEAMAAAAAAIAAEDAAAAEYLHIADIRAVRGDFGIFNDENYNAQGIIWHIITDRILNLNGLTIDNLIDLNNALGKVITDADIGIIQEQVLARGGLPSLRLRLNKVKTMIDGLIADQIKSMF